MNGVEGTGARGAIVHSVGVVVECRLQLGDVQWCLKRFILDYPFFGLQYEYIKYLFQFAERTSEDSIVQDFVPVIALLAEGSRVPAARPIRAIRAIRAHKRTL